MVSGNRSPTGRVEADATARPGDRIQAITNVDATIVSSVSSETLHADESFSTDGSYGDSQAVKMPPRNECVKGKKRTVEVLEEADAEAEEEDDCENGSKGSEAGENEACADDQVSSMEHKVTVIQRLYTEGISIRKFAQKYNLSRTTLVKWKSKYDRWVATGINTFHSDGRPSVLDEIGEANIIQVATAAAAANRHLMRRELQSVIESEIVDSKRRRGMENDREGVSGETVRRIIKRLKTTFGDAIFSNGTGQHVADARDVFAGYCMMMACVRDMHYDRICNISSATFGVERKTEGLRVFMRAAKARSAGGVEVPSICVRLFYGSCGDGVPSMDPIYLLPDPGLGDGEFEWTSLVAGHAKGFVCFTSNGRPNGRFQYWLMNQAIRWCQALLIGKFPTHIGDGRDPMRSTNRIFLIVDDRHTFDTGPVAAAVMDSRVVDEYYVGFVPHSYSLNPFLTVLKRRILYSHNSYQSNALSGIDQNLANELKRILDTRTGYTDLDRVCYSEALRQLSFGVDYCQDTSCGGIAWGTNFRSTMAQAGRFYRDSEIAAMEGKLVKMVELFRVQGYLTDAQLIEAGVMRRNCSAAPPDPSTSTPPGSCPSSTASSSSSFQASSSSNGSVPQSAPPSGPTGGAPNCFQGASSSSSFSQQVGLLANSHSGQPPGTGTTLHHPFSGQVPLPSVEQRGRVFLIYPVPGMVPVQNMPPTAMAMGVNMMYPGMQMPSVNGHGAMQMPGAMQPQPSNQQMQLHHMQQMRQQMHQHQHQQTAINPLAAGIGDVYSYPHLPHALPPHLSPV